VVKVSKGNSKPAADNQLDWENGKESFEATYGRLAGMLIA